MSAAATHVETDVLIIGSGGAGMYAAIEAARAGWPAISLWSISCRPAAKSPAR